MRVEQVELRLVRVPYRRPFRTSFGSEDTKHALLVTVRADGLEGYGEGVMEPLPRYREETIHGATHLLSEALAPDLLASDIASPAELVDRWAGWRGNPMAKAALELAVWDLAARRQNVSLSTLLGGSGEAVAVGASLGMDEIGATVADAVAHAEQGYQRIKLKVGPGHDVELLAAVRAALPATELTVDANSAYTLDDLDVLRSIDGFGLAYIEQPLHWDDLVDHAALAAELVTPICLDETLTSTARVRAALDLGACAVVNAKVGRLGGIEEVRRTHQLCLARDVPMWCGGMLETGIGRAHNIHLATLPGFVMPGDTASASRTYARDIVEQELEAVDGWMAVPTGPGIGVSLDRPFLASVTDAVVTLRR